MTLQTDTLPTSSLVDICYAELRQLIVTCELEPGSRINEKGLIARLGYGRTPVREALLRLTQERLIDTLPRSGYRIRPLTRKAIDDFFTVWMRIAPLIASLAVGRLNEEHLKRLDELGRERTEIEEGDNAAMSRIAASFFNILVDATDNEPLTYIYHRLGAEMERIFQFFFRTPAGRNWLSTKQEIVAFGRVTDPDSVAQRVEQRVALSRQSILEMFDADEAAASSGHVPVVTA